MTTLLLVRHSETDWNAERRFQGHADVPLNTRGREQAERLAADLTKSGVGVVYSSDLSRARETAEIVGARLGIEVILDPDLREVDVGSRQGLTWSEAQELTDWDGESREAHAERILGALERIAAQHRGERVLVVTHGGSMRRVHDHLGLDTAPFENCAVWACAHEDGVLRELD
ncbi:MAG TPA: histidine phosphatase family protein [Gaiellaceae bacterium]|nr:histidine phosphatase family protein [Gaiellaceae bacterium]